MAITIYQDPSGYAVFTANHQGFMYMGLNEAIVVIAALCKEGAFIDNNSRPLYISMLQTQTCIKLNESLERAGYV